MASVAANVSDDTRAILALCSRARGSSNGRSVEPLTGSEYHALAVSMRDANLRPADLFGLPDEKLRELAQRSSKATKGELLVERVRALLDRGALIALPISELVARGIWIVGRGDTRYPSRYRNRLGAGAPPLLYGCGPVELLERGGLGVVGSREPDPCSIRTARDAGRLAAKRGVPVISGTARGIDEFAMMSAVEEGGEAVGVLAESLFKFSVRADYRDAIRAKHVTLVTPYEPDSGFSVQKAMARNRLIYALADTSLVVAATDARGGTWAGAVEALRQNRTVYVVVGNPARPGNDALVRHGGRPVGELSPAIFSADPASAALSDPDGSKEPRAEILELVTPTFLAALAEPRSAKAIAVELRIVPTQAKRLLDELVKRGRILYANGKYRLAEQPPTPRNDRRQLSLIPGDAASARARKRRPNR